jgi:uncharacterized protein YqeY
MTYEDLKEEIKNAMRAKDKPRLAILRQVHGELKDIEVNERRAITDEDVATMIKRVLKQTGETLEGSIKANNNQERTDTLKIQIAVLEELLPEQVSGDELAELVKKTIQEVGAETKRDMGKVMGALGKATGGNFDKAAAAQEAGRLLS